MTKKPVRSRSLSDKDIRELWEAHKFAAVIGKPLTTLVDFHPRHLKLPLDPDQLNSFFRRDLLVRLADWCAAKGIGWYAIATREAYDDPGSEHLHIQMALPTGVVPSSVRIASKYGFRRSPGWTKLLTTVILGWYPDADLDLVRVHTVRDHAQVHYRFKQKSSRAAGPPRPGRRAPERRKRPGLIHGKRYFISRTLSRRAREKFQEREAAWSWSTYNRSYSPRL